MIPEDRLAVVSKLCREIPAHVVWALTGSAAHALHGVDVAVRDVDVLTDREGALAIAGVLSSHVVRPVAWRAEARIRSWFGVLAIGGVEVELMGDVELRAGDGSWSPPADVAARRELVHVGALAAPVMPLAHEVAFYEQLGRRERADRLRARLDAT